MIGDSEWRKLEQQALRHLNRLRVGTRIVLTHYHMRFLGETYPGNGNFFDATNITLGKRLTVVSEPQDNENGTWDVIFTLDDDPEARRYLIDVGELAGRADLA